MGSVQEFTRRQSFAVLFLFLIMYGCVYMIKIQVIQCLCIGVCTCVQMLMEARCIGYLEATVVGKVS